KQSGKFTVPCEQNSKQSETRVGAAAAAVTTIGVFSGLGNKVFGVRLVRVCVCYVCKKRSSLRELRRAKVCEKCRKKLGKKRNFI
ncbi:AGAP010840-PA, partial [Anopheles gambiae str. PEST]